MELQQKLVEFCPFWTHRIKTKAKYISISNILHLLSAPVSITRVETVWASLVVISVSYWEFVSNFCLIVDSSFHPIQMLTRSKCPSHRLGHIAVRLTISGTPWKA